MRWKLFTVLVPVGSVMAWVAYRGCRTWMRREVEAEAAERHRRFLRRLDHELKNPLTAIEIGLANLAESHGEEGWQTALSSVQTQVLRISQLTSDLRKLAELETLVIERVPVNIPDLLHEAVALARERPEAATRKLTLRLSPSASSLPTVSGDRDLLFLAVHNLLDNALKFSQPGDAIEVRGFEEDEHLVIEVADTGPGIPEEELVHVWEDLYRGRAARGIPGAGLGLGLVHTIVHRHDGEVALCSHVGEGTAVTMRLPTT